ncbi:glycosyl hydrolase family 18 protein [Streptomyces sp. NRRL F-2202]|uniref:glycosyl hydrolase family 18 protein n=1 Tax=Streptomyces sp. NRRL F-2202 TaxID=1463839 RepID=UPI00051594BF|nr:glycosyl hydrolase family 18 protein [Streptomyces sp. NRRL F-2202]
MSTQTRWRRARSSRTASPGRRSKTLAGATALLVPLAAMVGLAAPAEAASSATAVYTKASDWGSGFEGKWTVKNTGTTTLSTWSVEWDFPANTKVTSAWDATVTNSANHWTAKNLGWNGTLAPGASVSFGFNGSGTGTPSGCKLNGNPCDGGSTNPGDNAPSAPGKPTASDVTNSSAKLSWAPATDDKGIKNYDVKRDGATVATVTGTTYTDTGLTAGTDYSYSVVARDTADQTGPASAATTVRTTGSGGGGENPGGNGKINLGYFTNWGSYTAKDLVTSGSAEKITHINYAFGNVQNGKCTIGDAYEDYQKSYSQSCYDLVEDPRWADVFDGIDLDWEYPNACGLTCDSSGPAAFKNMMQAMRAKFGANNLLTAAITADGSNGGKIDAADYGGAAQYINWYDVMTYDFFGAWAAQGPTAPHSPLTSYPGIPAQGFTSADAIAKLKAKGVPASKLLLGIGFYGRGWTGVTQSAPGGTATGPAAGVEPGNQYYKVLKTACPATGTVGGTAYAHCGKDWWSYDTPATVGTKMAWAKSQGLGGAFFWEFNGDTTNGELVTAISSGLK